MKTAMVWGAAGGIGRALVMELVDQGWRVVAAARNAGELHTLTPYVVEADVADPYAVQSAVMAVAQDAETIDLWIYAAGDIVATPVADMPLDDWQRILDANLTGAFLTFHHSLPLLAPDAHIVIVAAISERVRLPGLAAYASAKAGLEAFAETLRKEQRKRRVTVARPGAVATPFWDKVPFNLPVGAMQPDSVARAIVDAHDSGYAGVLDLNH